MTLPLEARAPETRVDVLESHLNDAEKNLVMARQGLADAEKGLDLARKPVQVPQAEKAALVISDTFSSLDPSKWKTIGNGKWKTLGEAVAQTAVIPDGARLRLAEPVPADFEAVLRFKLTGGEPYRSVGIAFDVSDDLENLVYLSASAADPKIQGAVEPVQTQPVKAGG